MVGRARMALSENRYAEAASMARRALTGSDTRPDPLNVAGLKDILGLALLGLGSKIEGRRSCEESLAAAAKFNDVTTLVSARLALLQARLETGDRAGALSVFHEAEPALAGHPESRWRALALMARADRQYASSARQALDAIARQWGDAAFRLYLARPDMQKLSLPLTQSISASQK
jgi:hypothetical protein